MSRRYPVPAARRRVEEEILRSRFITTIGAAATVEEARAFIAGVQAEFQGASHTCWAYVVGPPASSAQNGLSDDGEPHGTAGRPMLTVLLHSGVGDVVATVTRFFGGTLLGTGGLVRAYSGGVQAALQGLPLLEKRERVQLVAVLDYGALSSVRRLLPEFEAELLDEEFAGDVTLRLRLPAEQAAPLTAALIDLTHGQALIEPEPA